MTDARTIHWKLRQDARRMREAAILFNNAGRGAKTVELPTYLMIDLARSLETVAGNLATVAELLVFEGKGDQ